MNRVAGYRWGALLEVGLLVSLLVVGPRTPTALANPAAVLRGVHGIYATKSNSITLASETVVIELLDGGTRSKARCEFHLRNETVRNQDLQLGFPDIPVSHEEMLAGPPPDFKAYVGGVEVPVTQEVGEPTSYLSWATFEAPFPAGQETTVVNTYCVPNELGRGKATVRYILATGAYWSQPIGRATVTVKLGDVPPHAVERADPDGWRFTPDGRALVWHAEHFKPQSDLSLVLNLAYCDPDSRFTVHHRQSLRDAHEVARRAEFDALLKGGVNVGQAVLAATYQRAVASHDRVLAALVRAFLADEAVPDWRPYVSYLEVRSGLRSYVHARLQDDSGDLAGAEMRLTCPYYRGDAVTNVSKYATLRRPQSGNESTCACGFEPPVNVPSYADLRVSDAAGQVAVLSLRYTSTGNADLMELTLEPACLAGDPPTGPDLALVDLDIRAPERSGDASPQVGWGLRLWELEFRFVDLAGDLASVYVRAEPVRPGPPGGPAGFQDCVSCGTALPAGWTSGTLRRVFLGRADTAYRVEVTLTDAAGREVTRAVVVGTAPPPPYRS